jgi:uncharacterized LabA/DUF88 family protein
MIALIDGFNFYHPIKYYQKKREECLQWLDYPSLLRYYIKQTPQLAKGVLHEVYFFTALANWRNQFSPGTTDRHLTYINVLKQANVQVVLGNFKEKQNEFRYSCGEAKPGTKCLIQKKSHEEKETDVRIACKLLELAVKDVFDTCFLLSADSDLVPAIETLKTLYPNKKVVLVTPPNKAKIDKLKRLSAWHISVGVNDLKRHQFPNEIETESGHILVNPWKTIELKN